MTVDPILQAILALCSHPEYVPDCAPCEVRRVEASRHLVAMIEQIRLPYREEWKP